MNKTCNTWASSNTLWNQNDSKWNECIYECVTWGTTDVFWKNADWIWRACKSGSIPPIPPPIPTEVIYVGGVDATTLIQPWQLEEPWNAYKNNLSKRKIRLICKINDKEYSEEKEIGNSNVSVGNVQVSTNKSSYINLKLNLEE